MILRIEAFYVPNLEFVTVLQADGVCGQRRNRADTAYLPTDYESLADNQPQLTTTACVTFLTVTPDFIGYLLL